MAFNETQTHELAGKLPERHVKTREQRGKTLSYVEGWHVIAEANRIFGFDGWDRETVWAERLWEDARRDPKACAYGVRVRIRVRAGTTIVCRDGSGVGHGTGSTLGEAHESALKEAETDAMKRALVTFGNVFGLALYDKQQSGVRHRAKSAPRPALVKNPLEFYGADGEVLSRHETAPIFCTALKTAMTKVTGVEELQAFWVRNEPSVNRIRAEWPDLLTPQGLHYADLLKDVYHRNLARVQAPGPAPLPETEKHVVDKSALLLSAPRRVRDRDHLRLVASLPCLICGRSPSQAHHLRFTQARSMSSKVSDEWTVPLCIIHHRALHDVGDEAAWWEEQRLDAKAEAEKLWRERRTEVGAATISPTKPNEEVEDRAVEISATAS